MTTFGSGKYTYELIQDWPKLPQGEALGIVSTVATDSRDRVYAFQRQDPPVMVFDRAGNYLNCWGIGAIADPHGMTIVDDIVYNGHPVCVPACHPWAEGKGMSLASKYITSIFWVPGILAKGMMT